MFCLHTHTHKKKNPEPCSLDWEEAFDILALFLILQKKKNHSEFIISEGI